MGVSTGGAADATTTNTNTNTNTNTAASPRADSLQVHPGSPQSIPSLHHELDEKYLVPESGDESNLKDHDSASSSSDLDEKLPDAAGLGQPDAAAADAAPATEQPATHFIIDPAGLRTHDSTTVDVVTVPCPGGHALRSWNRDGLLSRFFGAPSMRDAEVGGDQHQQQQQQQSHSASGTSCGSDRSGASWVRQGIRREADRARILLYEHPDELVAQPGATLSRLADALLEELGALRAAEDREERPVMFVGHSVGGLVVKMALVKASRDARYSGILKECYGVAFFGTPHQGSSYFSMPSLACSIKTLLQLSHPLAASLADELRVGNALLLRVDDDFKTISTDFRVWTFYETIDSRLAGSGPGDACFTAPLTSVRSAILGMRRERVFPLQSDHANMASFGRHNVQTMRLFLRQLAAQVHRADAAARAGPGNSRWALDLEQKVNIEVHGFFEDPVAALDAAAAGGPAEGPTVRAWSTRLPLGEFLAKGPEECLSERLNEVEGAPEESRFLRRKGRTSLIDEEQQRAMADKNALGIRNQLVEPRLPPKSPILKPITPEARQVMRSGSVPPAPLGSPNSPPSNPVPSPPSRYSMSIYQPSPVMRADFDQDLAVDQLSPVPRPPRPRGRSMSRSYSVATEASPFEYRDFPPFSQRSRSTFDAAANEPARGDDVEASPELPAGVAAIRAAARQAGIESSEEVIVEEVPVAFAKPDASARKFMWIHLPFNNPTWVKNVLETLQLSYKKDLSSLYDHDFWATKHTRGRHSQHYAYHAKPGCYYTGPRGLSRTHSLASPSLSPRAGNESMHTCLFLPYLHFDSYKNLIRRRELILQRVGHGRAHPVPDSVAKSDSVEMQVIWEFLGHDPPLNCRRTLDQYGYPSLRDTRSRDDDQMLYKLTKDRMYLSGHQRDLYSHWSSSQAGWDKIDGGSWRQPVLDRDNDADDDDCDDDDDRKPEDKVLNGNVLMVDQMWLWALNSHTLLSFFPKRESDPIEGPLYQQADLRDSIFNEVNVDLTRQCLNALDLAALAALHAVSVLLDRTSHPDLEIFRIFEEAISVLTEKLTSSLKAFRAEGFRDKAFDYEPVENKERSIRARHKEESRRAEEENRDNTSALLELRDLEDELLVLLHLFERQSKVLSSMHAIYIRPEMRDLTVNGRVFLNEALKRLGDYVHQADEMILRVRSTRDDYDKLLQMMQRQAQVDEVRLSRFHADLASAQSRSVMIFTTFTVIFLPLSFFTSLFGMNTREWGGGGNLPLREIGSIALPASALLIVGTLFVAWSTTARRGFHWASRTWRAGERWAYREAWRPAARMVARARRRRRGRKNAQGQGRGGGAGGWTGQREGGVQRDVSDFWERHRLERERGYQIPEVNRKGEEGGLKSRWGSKKKESKAR